MAKFRLDETVPLPTGAVTAAPLGVNAAGKFVDADKGKAVKRGAARNWVLVADGDDLEGVVMTIEPNTVNNGFSFGSVKKHLPGNTLVTAVNAGAGALALGAQVVCAAQTALGTPQTIYAGPKVKAGTGEIFRWRVVELWDGAGAVGQKLLLEAIP